MVSYLKIWKSGTDMPDLQMIPRARKFSILNKSSRFQCMGKLLPYPNVERCVVYWQVKIYKLLDLQACKCFWNATRVVSSTVAVGWRVLLVPFQNSRKPKSKCSFYLCDVLIVAFYFFISWSCLHKQFMPEWRNLLFGWLKHYLWLSP